MAYPTLPVAYGSDPEFLSGLEVDRAEDGTARARSFFVADKRRWTLEHPMISAANKAALDAHYAANKVLSFDFACPASGATYTVVYTNAPTYEIQPGNWYVAKVELEQV